MKRTLILVVAMVAILSFQGCSENGGTGPTNGNPLMEQDVEGMIAQIAVLPSAPLTTSLSSGLAHMREEEKLARDVYLTFAEQYGTAVFSTIAASESNHMRAMKVLLDKYGIPDPVVSDARGVFSDTAFTSLYQTLVRRGSAGLSQALAVGATIEDLDIKDLLDLSAQQPSSDVQFVYDNLRRASENHLRAFSAQLRAAGGSYTPQYISQTQYDAILAARSGRGWRR